MSTLDYNTHGGGGDMGRVVHFELPADDPERAVAFNKATFGTRTVQY
jgi:predicted enzyme related to lactoylglutathione lyase